MLFIQGNMFASGFYRVGFVAEYLKKHSDKISVDYFKQGDKADNFLFRIGNSDIVVFQLQTDDIIREIIPVCISNGVSIIMDMDDDLLNVPQWNPSYFSLGREVVNFFQLATGEKMNIAENLKRLENIEAILRSVSLITVTGKGLRNEYSKFNKVKMIPNAVDPSLIKESKRSNDGKVRIFWQGSSTHIADLHSISDAIRGITKLYPQVQWVIWGSLYKDFAKRIGIPEGRVEHHETVDFNKYYKKLASMKMDIGICPLLKHPYNACKSFIKWEEYSLCGIPTVASDVRPYNDAIREGETGYLAGNTSEWISALSGLIENPVRRELFAGQAKRQVLQEYSMEPIMKRWEETLIKLHERNKYRI